MQKAELEPGVVCLSVHGELEMMRAYDFDQELRALEERDLTALVVDLRDVTFVDSAGLSRILAANRRALKNGHCFAVVRGCRAVERLFALTATDQTVRMISEPEAVLA